MEPERRASPDLETFIDQSIKISREHGYHPTVFIGMRQKHGTIKAIERLVESGEIQAGFKKLRQLNLLDWTIEAAVTKFANEFSRNALKCAEWRLQQAGQRKEHAD